MTAELWTSILDRNTYFPLLQATNERCRTGEPRCSNCSTPCMHPLLHLRSTGVRPLTDCFDEDSSCHHFRVFACLHTSPRVQLKRSCGPAAAASAHQVPENVAVRYLTAGRLCSSSGSGLAYIFAVHELLKGVQMSSSHAVTTVLDQRASPSSENAVTKYHAQSHSHPNQHILLGAAPLRTAVAQTDCRRRRDAGSGT